MGVKFMSDEREDAELTLTNFVDQNHKLLTIGGMFATFAVLASRLPDIGKLISFVLSILVFIIAYEIYKNFPPEVQKGTLHWFREVFCLLVLGFGGFLISVFYPFLLVLVSMVIYLVAAMMVFALCMKVIRTLIKKVPWFKNVGQNAKERLIPVFGSMALMVAAWAILRHVTLLKP
jgi:hypothetical protein